MLGILHTHLHPYYLNHHLHPSVHFMLQRASAEQKALTYKKEGGCFKGAVRVHPECVLQFMRHFRENGCFSVLGKASSLALVGSPLAQHGVEEIAISLLTESKGHKILIFLGKEKRGSFLPDYAGCISWSCCCGAWLEKMGRMGCASGLLRGQTRPLLHSDLCVAVPSSRHKGDLFTSLHEFPCIPEVLGSVSLSCFFTPAMLCWCKMANLPLPGQCCSHLHLLNLSFILRGVADLI